MTTTDTPLTTKRPEVPSQAVPTGFPPMGQQLSDRAARHPDAPALSFGGRTVTYSELDREANRLARAYADLGVRQGDIVTIALPNSIECVVTAWAAWKLGASPQPVSPVLPEAERTAIIDLADPALVVGAQVPDRRCVPSGFTPDDALSDAPLPPAPAPSWKVMTSGGSTGRPKLIAAGGTSELNPQTGQIIKLQEGGVVCSPGPLYHNTTFMTCALGLLMGNHVVLLERFDAEQTLRAVQDHRIDVLVLVPTMMVRMLRVLQGTDQAFDLSSLRVLWHLAAPCPEWVKVAWIDLLGPDRVWELYAGTEFIALTHVGGADWLAHRGTVGQAVLGEMIVLDEDGRALPPGEIGEIFMRAPDGSGPTYRYVGSEAKVIDGWTTLGDLGWMDEQGYVYLSDRRTDLILAGGANVYPAEVESALLEHPDVLSVVVVGLPDDELGQRVHAVVQVASGPDEQSLRDFMASRLVRYKQPRSYRFVDETLRDDAGKTRRMAVRDTEIAVLRTASAGSS